MKKYAVDEMLKTEGIIPVRLPPYFCIYNPIEIIWGLVKTQFRKENPFSKDIQTNVDLVQKVCDNIPSVYWKNICDHVMNKVEAGEREMAVLSSECLVNKELVIVINAADESISSEEEESKSCDIPGLEECPLLRKVLGGR